MPLSRGSPSYLLKQGFILNYCKPGGILFQRLVFFMFALTNCFSDWIAVVRYWKAPSSISEPAVNKSKCPWTGHWTPNCFWCCIVSVRVCEWWTLLINSEVVTATSGWVCVYMGECKTCRSALSQQWLKYINKGLFPFTICIVQDLSNLFM